MQYLNDLHLIPLSTVLLPESLETHVTDISTGQYQSLAKDSNSEGHTAGAPSVKGKAPPLPAPPCHTPPHGERKRHKPLQSYKFIGLEINTNISLRNCPGKTCTMDSCLHPGTLGWIPDLSTQGRRKPPW